MATVKNKINMATVPTGIKSLKSEVWTKFSVTRNGVTYKTHMLLSNYGRLASSAYGEWKLLSTKNLTSGFPSYNFRIYKEKDKETAATENKMLDRINSFYQKVYKLRKSALKVKKKSEIAEYNKEIKKTTEKINDLKKEKSAFLKEKIQDRVVSIHMLYHKEVAKNFLEKPKNKAKKFVIHLDHNKENNYYKNLRWADQAEVTKHNQKNPTVIEARENRVATKKHYRLNPKNVGAIKTLLKQGVPLAKIAKKYKVSDMQIHRIKTGECWPEVKAS